MTDQQEQEGPRQITTWTCQGCKHYELWCGVGWCHVDGDMFNGRVMPEDGCTPSWCPLLPKEQEP